MTWFESAAVAVAVLVGACAQGSFGFGLGLVAAPVLGLVDDRLIPGPLLLVAFALTGLVALRERGSLDWRGIRWAVVGRVPGSVLGALAVVLLPERGLVVLFAALVLVAVGLSVAGWVVHPTPPTLFTAGAASGFMGSITSIGGPPMALVYQRRTGKELRSSLALFFLFGSALSIGLLVGAGEIGSADVGRACWLLPAMLVGFLLSRRVSEWLDRGRVRAGILLFSAIASAVLLVSQFV